MEVMIDFAIQSMLNLFEVYIIYRYMTIFFEDKFLDKKLVASAYGSRLILAEVLCFIEVYPIVTAMLFFVGIFLIALSYMAALSKKIIISMLVFMCSFISEAIVALAIGIGGYDPFGEIAQINALLTAIIKLIFWAITLIVQKFKNIRKNMPIPKIFIVAIIIIPVSSFYLELMIFQQKNIEHNMAGLSLVCILASNFILIYLYDSLLKMFQERTKAAIVLREKEYYHEQSELLKRRHEELRQFRHDMKNRMLVIQQMIKEDKYDKALEYTEKMEEKLAKMEVYSTTGNIAIDSVINYKLTRANEKGIRVEPSIVIPENISISEDDIVVLLGNLLDNAIEAAESVKDDKYINISCGYDRGNMFIHIENSHCSTIILVNGKIVTSKKDTTMHGIGLQSIDAIVQKYNGLLEIDYTDEKFIVDILLYI